MRTIEQWIDHRSKSMIQLKDASPGYEVALLTTQPVGTELTRMVYAADVIDAATRVTWLMTQLPGMWEIVRDES
jgi:hypothetical protein